ncbi:ribosomal protein S18 acetylase RimI-like enzyme [Paraburkholderia sp. BL23I1N1]|uniref:GNAT family N-acetyltransferase n=1 Tax=Paraburkholderia sp. BL23I1N1 TaxID=1938802 RepID=UPI000E756399|nr:GNAT family N-acetyltransferase [Paraburkholderia sp. BL23I1N1]RKE25173.1 ribosomal protein S18 acetylase RimI-like enzyme [Paraburkholderia sp. BL23I1N1]
MRTQTADSAEARPDAGRRSIEEGGDRLCLRSASECDRAFLREVFESTRADEFARTGWRPERIVSLLAEQFSMQDTYYRRHYPHGRFDVVVLGERAVGRLYHDWHGSEARLIDIALLPAHRGAGIGTRLLRAFVTRAAARAVPVVLYVEMNNPVQGLYRRLDFEPVGENGIYIQMRRPVMPFGDVDVASVDGLGHEAEGTR